MRAKHIAAENAYLLPLFPYTEDTVDDGVHAGIGARKEEESPLNA